MKSEIKQRIEQIKAGQVPAGYKRTKAGIMPCEWCSEKEYKAKDVFKSVTNKKHNGEFEVLSATQDKGVIPRSQVDIDIKFNEDNIVGYKKVDKGDFVISLRSFQGGIEYAEYEGLVSPAYTVLKPKIPICDGYYKAYLKTVDYIRRLNKGTYGIRDGKQIGFEDFGDMIIHYPSLVEQEKIAEILSAQDKVVELKEKLLEEKKKQKKYLMQQLLTGKKRLPGYSDSWNEVCLTEICDFNGGSQPPKSEWINEYKEGYINILQTRDFTGSREAVTEYVRITKSIKQCKENDILLARYGASIGKVLTGKSGAYNVALMKTIPDENVISKKYLYYILCGDEFQEFIKTVCLRAAQAGFNKDDLSEFMFYIPCVDEQNKITLVLGKADDEIQLFENELDQEKQKKKALMQLLLTGIVRV